MAWDCWRSIQEKLESAEFNLGQASRDIHPDLPPHYIAIQATGVDVSDPRWRAKLSSHVSAFLVECRCVPDIIQSCFGVDSRLNRWVNTLSPDEQRRRREFKNSFKYESFSHLRMSQARVDSVHRQGFADIWVKVGKRHCPLQELDHAEMKRFLAGSDPASQWAATLPPQRGRYQLNDFFFKTVGGRYKLLFPESNRICGRHVSWSVRLASSMTPYTALTR